jgi:hypothetical protein
VTDAAAPRGGPETGQSCDCLMTTRSNRLIE